MLNKEICMVFFIFLCFIGQLNATERVVVGYYPYYITGVLPADKIQLQHLTHVMHSFAYPDEEGNILYPSNFIYPELNQRIHNEGKEIYIALGGAGQSDAFATMAADSTARANFITNIIEFCTTHNYDGIDIDWEHPANNKDKISMNKLVNELREAAPNLGITVTLPGSNWVGRYIDYTYLTPLVDWFNIMVYDMYGPWSSTSGHHSPIYDNGGNGSVEHNMNYLMNTRGIPTNKLVLGVPFYGYIFNSSRLGNPTSSGSTIVHSNIVLNINDGWEYFWDDFAKSPYLVSESSDQVISYNNMETISLKCDYAIDLDLLGVMIWEISQDYRNGEQPLLERIGLKILETEGKLTSSVKLTEPFTNFQIQKGDTLMLSAEASDSVSSISKVEFYIDSAKVGEDNIAPYEINYIWQDSIKGYYSIKALAYNSNDVATPSERAYVKVIGSTVEQIPLGGTPHSIPGTIEAEDFDIGGEGVSWYDSTPGNIGVSYRTDVDVDIEPCVESDYNIGYITDGEWFEYTVNVEQSDSFDIDFRVAALNQEGALHLEIDGVDITGSITTPITGGWQKFQTVTASNVELTEGEHVLRFYVEKGDFNLDIMNFYLSPTSVEDDKEVISQFKLYQNYPNPFNPSTNISFSLPNTSIINLSIYDVKGALIKELINEKYNAGSHTVSFNPSGLSSGVYFYKLMSKGNTEVKPMIYLK